MFQEGLLYVLDVWKKLQKRKERSLFLKLILIGELILTFKRACRVAGAKAKFHSIRNSFPVPPLATAKVPKILRGLVVQHAYLQTSASDLH